MANSKQPSKKKLPTSFLVTLRRGARSLQPRKKSSPTPLLGVGDSSGGPRLPGVGEGGEVQRLEASASGEKCKCKKFPESMDAVMGALSDPHQTK